MTACHFRHDLPFLVKVPLLVLLFVVLIGCLIMLVEIIKELRNG